MRRYKDRKRASGRSEFTAMSVAGALATLLTGVAVAYVSTLPIPGIDPHVLSTAVNGVLVGAFAIVASKLRDFGLFK